MKFSVKSLIIQLILVFTMISYSDAIKLLNRRTMRYLDSNNRGQVFTHRIVHVSSYKNWNLVQIAGTNFYNIVNIPSGLYLEGRRGQQFVYATRVVANSNNQQWLIRGNFIIHRGTGFVLDSNLRGQVYLHRYNGGHWQRWLPFK